MKQARRFDGNRRIESGRNPENRKSTTCRFKAPYRRSFRRDSRLRFSASPRPVSTLGPAGGSRGIGLIPADPKSVGRRTPREGQPLSASHPASTGSTVSKTRSSSSMGKAAMAAHAWTLRSVF